MRVAVDGPDATGKTTLADELAAELSDREVIRASIDGWHRPRAERYRLGEDSPAGYYRDSFAHHALRRELLDPLGPGGDRSYRAAVFDFRTDTALALPRRSAGERPLLIFDGVFLLRPELRDAWDLAVFVRCSPDESLRRALVRDLAFFGPAEEIDRRCRTRYLLGQELYLSEARPLANADVVVDNDDPEQPRLSWPCPGDSPC